MSKNSKARRVPSVLSETLYCYVEKTNYARAKKAGEAKFGSFSNYVNFLIAQEAGDKASMARSMALAAKYNGMKTTKPKKKKKAAKKSKRIAKGKKASRKVSRPSQKASSKKTSSFRRPSKKVTTSKTSTTSTAKAKTGRAKLVKTAAKPTSASTLNSTHTLPAA